MKKKLFTLVSIIVSGAMYSQNGNVGINVATPTRNLDINGSLKVRELSDVSDIATYPSYDRILVSDNGTDESKLGNVDYINIDELFRRLGIYPAVSEFKTTSASSSSTTDAITLTAGCLKIQADPYYPILTAVPNIGYNISIDPSCGSSSWSTIFVVDGNNVAQGSDYWRGTLTNTPTTVVEIQTTTQNSAIKFGRVVLHDLKQVYEVTWTTNGTSTVTHSLYIRRIY